MKGLKKRKKRTPVPAGSQTKKGKVESGIQLGDGTIHKVEHEKLGWFVGWWNEEKCQCRVITAKILDGKKSVYGSHPWWKPYIGDEVQAIEISYYGQTFFISNIDGAGMQKITVGKGSPHSTHSQLEFVETVEIIQDQKQWIMEFDFQVSLDVAKKGEPYWQVRDPEHWKRLLKKRVELEAYFYETMKEVKDVKK